MLAQREPLATQDLLQRLKQDASCPICCNMESALEWRQLPCQHGCCENCLENWCQAIHHQNGGKTGDLQFSRQLSCPFCRGCTTLPPEGIKAFPTSCKERNDLEDLMTFVGMTQGSPQANHACALCPYDIGEHSTKLFNYCKERQLTLCSMCQGRFSAVPSAPPMEEAPQPTRTCLTSVWSSEPTRKGHYTDAVVVTQNSCSFVVVCDYYEGCLFIFSANDGKCILRRKTSYKPFCLACDENKGIVLVTKSNSTSLCYLDAYKLKDIRVSEKIKASEQPQGLARLQDNMTVVAEDNKTIATYDVTGKCVQRWRCNMKPHYVTAKDDVVIVSFRDDNCIVAFDLYGNRKWKVTFQKPRGVAVDEKGRVLVVHESQDGDSQVSLCCMKNGQLLGQFVLPPVEVHSQDRLIKVMPCEGKLLLMYNHCVRMTNFL